MTLNLALNAIISGLLLAGVYAIASLGLTITFGLLQIPNVAHPTFIVLGAYCAQLLNSFGLDPIIAGLLFTPLFYLGGVLLYQIYFQTFERRGRSDTLQSFTFFFGIALVLQVSLILVAGVDLTSVSAPYIGKSLRIGPATMPYRLVIPFVIGMTVGLGMWLHADADARRAGAARGCARRQRARESAASARPARKPTGSDLQWPPLRSPARP